MNYIRNNIDNIKHLGSCLATILGVVINIISAVGVFNSNENILLVISGILLAVGTISTIYYNIILSQRWNSLILLAHRGHLHTIRMILMRDYQKRHRNDEGIETDITKANNFLVEKAIFSFKISKKENNNSNVFYKHSFEIISKRKGLKIFYPWFFGDNNAKPVECVMEIKIGYKRKQLDLKPKPVKNPYINYPINEGIYNVNVIIGEMGKNEAGYLIFSYRRLNAYEWGRDEKFVIYPLCYAKKIVCADFVVEFEDIIGTNLISIELSELVCNGKQAKENKISSFQKSYIYRGVRYVAEDISINVRNVYLITIRYIDQKD